MAFIALDQLTPTRVEWLWPGRLALRYLAMLDGDPGLGKSLLTLDLCARITTGRPFPDGAAVEAPAPILLVNAEDGVRDTIHGRLVAAGADVSRVFVWERTSGEAPLRLPSQVGRLEQALVRTGARYVVLDPIMSFLESSVNVASDPSVRQALAPLADLAQRHRAAIMMVRHLNKGAGTRALYRGLYSIGFVAACRVGWLVGKDPRAPGQYVLTQLKNNLDPAQPALAYGIEGTPSGAARIDWRGPSIWSEDEVVAAPTARGARDRARDFLAGFLQAGPRTSREIWEAAQQHHLSARTLRRARRQLKIRCHRVGPFKPGQVCYWLMEGQELPDHVELAPEERRLDAFFRERERQFPPLNPLDEAER